MTNEPVLVNGAVSVITGILAPVFAKWGIDAGGTTAIVAGALTVISGGISVWRLIAARGRVTPVS